MPILNRIDGIYNYCDRWCERCPFTDRCTVFEVEAAVAMCGNARDGLDLALGEPRSDTGDPPAPPAWLQELNNEEDSAEEVERFVRAEAERRKRIDAHPLAEMCAAFTARTWVWLKQRRDALAAAADPVVVEALAVASHDAVFISPKVRRALRGFDEYEDDPDGDPIQSDWNGSAKVALMAIVRSEAAWRTVASASGDDGAAVIANRLSEMRNGMQALFPRAADFKRPGFDEAE